MKIFVGNLSYQVTEDELRQEFTGFGAVNYVSIVTDKYEEVRKLILEDLDRGGTAFDAVGMFQGTQKKVIYTVVSPRELGILKDNIRMIDPNAFMSVIDANEVLGKGFKSLEESAA